METEAERQLAKLVSMRTLTADIPANDNALGYLEKYFAERGMHCRRRRFAGHGTLVASTRPANHKTPTVLLAGHIDVVAGSDKLFKLQIKAGKITGRGVFDMKFALAGYMQLIDELRYNLHKYDFAVMVTADEESHSNGTRRLVKAGHLPKVCIIPDSTAPGWDIERAAKGSWRFDLIATGKNAHGSRPWEGESAALKLINALHQLQDEFQDQGPTTDSINIGRIQGGTAYNQIPQHMSAAVELRLTSQAAYDHFGQYITDLCKKHDVSMEEQLRGRAFQHDLNNPYVQSFMDSVEKLTGKRPKTYMSCGTSDASCFIDKGIPAIVSCPEGGGHHSENEWIGQKSFRQFVPILHDYLNKIALTPRLQSVDRPVATSVK